MTTTAPSSSSSLPPHPSSNTSSSSAAPSISASSLSFATSAGFSTLVPSSPPSSPSLSTSPNSLGPVKSWTKQQVAVWLHQNNLGKYAPMFADHEITGETLLELTLPYLKELQIHLLSDRIKIDKLIMQLRKLHATASQVVSPSHAPKISVPQVDSNPQIRAASIMSMDFVKLNCIKVTGEKNETHVIHIQGCSTYDQIMQKILSKFNMPTSRTESVCLFMHDAEGNTRALTNPEVIEICMDPSRWERENLVLRKKHTPFSFNQQSQAPGGTESSMMPTGYSGGAGSSSVPPPLSSSSSSSTSSLKKKDDKLNKFFGARPPSELISSNLFQFFPKEDERVTEIERRSSIHRLSIFSERPPSLSIDFKQEPLPPLLSASSILLEETKEEKENEEKEVDEVELGNEKETEPSGENMGTLRMESGSRDIAEVEKQPLSMEASVPPLPLPVPSAPSEWVKGSLIGQGSFGSVYLGLNSLTGELMAVKQVDLNQIRLESLYHEITFLSALHHPHIVRYLGASHEASAFNIFLEYIPGGSIYANLQIWGPFSESMVKSYMKQVLLGIDYLHAQAIIHRDIKAANILVDHHAIVKISDFGISQKTHADVQEVLETSLQGSVYWMAPEVVKKMMYSRKSDIWSLGCLFLEMVTAEHPWPNAGQVEAIFKIGSYAIPDLPENISEEATDFLKKIFQLDHQARPSAESLLKHPFIQK